MRFMATMAAVLLATAAVADEKGIGIAAVVDDQVISTVDLSERMALVMGTTGLPDTEETRARIVPQIVHQLVDEKIQMEEAARDGVSITDARLKEGVTKIEAQNGKEPGSLESFLDAKGLSKLSLYSQIRAQIAWSEVVMKKIRPRIKISDQEVARYIRRKQSAPVAPAPMAMAAAQPAPQGRVREVLIAAIHMPVDSPEREAGVRKLAEKLANEIRTGVNFRAIAQQFSSSASGATATDAFWVEVSQIDPAIAQALSHTPKGGITNPVRTSTGYQIVKLLDVKRSAPPAAAPTPAQAPVPAAAVAMEDEARAELTFKQILMSLKPDAKPKEADILLQLAKEVQQSPGKCEDKSMAGAGGLAEMDFRVTLTRALSSELPDKLRNFLMKLSVGQASEPVITPQGIRLFMLCERIDLPAVKSAPADSEDAIRQSIYNEKLELEAQKYMRDLRRQAFIEVRTH